MLCYDNYYTILKELGPRDRIEYRLVSKQFKSIIDRINSEEIDRCQDIINIIRYGKYTQFISIAHISELVKMNRIGGIKRCINICGGRCQLSNKTINMVYRSGDRMIELFHPEDLKIKRFSYSSNHMKENRLRESMQTIEYKTKRVYLGLFYSFGFCFIMSLYCNKRRNINDIDLFMIYYTATIINSLFVLYKMVIIS